MSDKMRIVFTNGAELVMPRMHSGTNVEEIISGKIQSGQRGLLRAYGGKRINPMEIAYIDVEYVDAQPFQPEIDGVLVPPSERLTHNGIFDQPKRGPGRPPTKLKFEAEETGNQ